MFLKRKENQAVVEHENVEGIWSLLNQNTITKHPRVTLVDGVISKLKTDV
jgi:hypothetical protein